MKVLHFLDGGDCGPMSHYKKKKQQQMNSMNTSFQNVQLKLGDTNY